MPNEHDDQHRKFTALYIGFVLRNDDPEKLGRVKVSIPGLLKETGWAFPLGWPGAGGKKRGMFAPPPKDAEVGVFFNQGNPDNPYYLSGNPGRGEAPDEVEDASSPEEAAKVFAYESDRFKFLFDGRKGKQIIALRDKKTGDCIEIDGVNLGIKIKATSAMQLECDGALNIKSSNLTLNGRTVVPNGKPI